MTFALGMRYDVARAPATQRDWYTSGEVASLLGVSDRTVVNWAKGGHLPHFTTPGGHRRFPAAAVHAFMERGTAGGDRSGTQVD